MELAPYPWQRRQWRRLIQQQQGDRIAHAYLLTGERGLGKKHFAASAAALLLCTSPSDNQACGSCRSCQLLTSGSNPDLLQVGPEDSKVIKIDHENRRISLGLKQLTEDPWEEIAKKYAVGTDCLGIISKVLDRGIIVELDDQIEGFVPTQQIGTDEIKDPTGITYAIPSNFIRKLISDLNP